MNKHQTYVTDNKVIVVSQYAGRRVKGFAKCSPEDKFDETTGIKLATLRCDEKVAIKRVKRSAEKVAAAYEAYLDAKLHLNAMRDYHETAVAALVSVQEELEVFEKTI